MAESLYALTTKNVTPHAKFKNPKVNLQGAFDKNDVEAITSFFLENISNIIFLRIVYLRRGEEIIRYIR